MGARGFLSSSPSSTAQALSPSECFFLLFAGCSLHRSHHKPSKPSVGSISGLHCQVPPDPLQPGQARPGCCSNTSADPPDHKLWQFGRVVLGLVSQPQPKSCYRTCSFARLLSLFFPTSSNLPMGGDSPEPQTVRSRAPGPPGVQPH